MIRLQLNRGKRDNYAFYCPISKLHLTLSSHMDVAPCVTPYILRGLKTKVLIDVDNVIDLSTGSLKVKEEYKALQEKEVNTPQEEEKIEDSIEIEEEIKVEDTPTESKPKKTKPTSKKNAE